MFELWSSFCELLPFEWARFGFMQRALLAAILLAPLFALPGCLVVNNRMAFFADAMGHAAFTGITIGALLGIAQPLYAMVIFAAFLAAAISYLRRGKTVSSDTIISIAMVGSMALGIVILSRRNSFANFTNYLIGDLLGITNSDIIMIMITLAIIFIIWIFCFNKLCLLGFNEAIARSRGVNVARYDMFFSVLVAVIVTIAVRWIGILVISSLLVLPASAARNLSHSVRGYTMIAFLISLVSCVSGLIISYYAETAGGASIVLVALGIYVVSLRVKKLYF